MDHLWSHFKRLRRKALPQRWSPEFRSTLFMKHGFVALNTASTLKAGGSLRLRERDPVEVRIWDGPVDVSQISNRDWAPMKVSRMIINLLLYFLNTFI